MGDYDAHPMVFPGTHYWDPNKVTTTLTDEGVRQDKGSMEFAELPEHLVEHLNQTLNRESDIRDHARLRAGQWSTDMGKPPPDRWSPKAPDEEAEARYDAPLYARHEARMNAALDAQAHQLRSGTLSSGQFAPDTLNSGPEKERY